MYQPSSIQFAVAIMFEVNAVSSIFIIVSVNAYVQNERLKKSSYAVSSKTAAGASMLFCVLLLVSFNFFPLRQVDSFLSHCQLQQ